MSILNIVSAAGNNDSIYPLLIRDCGIENAAKCILTYKQNAKESKYAAKEAARERIIDEYGTSAVWLGGVPLLNKASDIFIKKRGYAPEINIKLFEETPAQGLNLNIEKFKDKAPEIIEQMKKVQASKGAYKNLQILKLLASTAVPIALMGFVLPKMNFLYTKNKNKNKNKKQNFTNCMGSDIESFGRSINKSKQPSFKGSAGLANLSNLQKMMILDGGLTIGRVKTGRNKAEKAEMALKMGLMCYLNYIAPKNIEKILDKAAKSIFGADTRLDIKTLGDKDFMQKIKTGAVMLPKAADEKTIIDFIDSNINSDFVKQAEKLNLVSIIKNKFRDPRKYVNTDKIAEFKSAIEEFSKEASASGDFEGFLKKASRAKCFNIISNIAISSFLLAGVLPKIQFWFRKKMTNSNIDPGIRKYA